MADKKRKRTKAREYAVQLLYQHVITGDSLDKIKLRFWFSVDESDESIKDFSLGLAEVSINKMEEYDNVIEKFLKEGWTLNRIGEMEKIIMKVAIGELFEGDAPIFAIMDDYVTLAREFTNEKSASFVNGLLDNVRKQFQITR